MQLTPQEHWSAQICFFNRAAWPRSAHRQIIERLPEPLSGESVPIFGHGPCTVSLSGASEDQTEAAKESETARDWERAGGKETERVGYASRQNRIGHRGRVSLTREGSSGSGVRGEPSGVEGQLWSLALVTSPSARASNESNPSSSTGMLSRVSVSTASKLASFSSSIFLGGERKRGWGMNSGENRTV